MIKNKALLILVLMSVQVYADDYYEMYSQEDTESYLDEKDKHTLTKLYDLDKRKLSGTALVPGLVQFTYGAGIPTVVCAILEITDIAMETGERIYSVQLGDAARWSVDSAVSGDSSNRVEHLIVKPLDSGLKTSLLIATDRRTYHIRLKSSTKEFMPSITFFYPNKKINKPRFNGGKTGHEDIQYANTTDENNYSHKVSLESPSPEIFELKKGKRNYSYSIQGDDHVLPVNAYDDGVNTYIQMNSKLSKLDLPVVLQVTIEEGAFFDNERLSAVNYRVEDNTFVISGLYDQLRVTCNNGDSGIFADVKKLG